MKNKMKRMAAVLLCALLMACTLSVSAFAASEKINAKQYKNLPYQYYTYLGDSIPWGYGLDDSDSADPFAVGRRIKGSYTDLIGTVLETNNKAAVHPATCSGSRLSDFRYILERGMGKKNPYEFTNDWYGLRKPERVARLRTMGKEVVGELQQSDLITVQIGINDITAALVNAASATGLFDLVKLENMESLDDVVGYLAMVVGSLSEDSNVMGNFTSTFQKEMTGIYVNAKEVVKDCVTVAPKNADILVVGYHMAVQGIRVIPGTNTSILCDLIDSALASLNAVLASTTLQYDNAYYVSAPNAQVFYPEGTNITTLLKDTSSILRNVHPNAEGHRYIAGKVLEKLDEINT